jgi:hypothetical protein
MLYGGEISKNEEYKEESPGGLCGMIETFSFGEGGGDSRPPNYPPKVNLPGLKAGAWSRFILSAVERVNQEEHACNP